MAKTTQTFYENSVYKFRDTEAEIDIDVFDNTAKGDITEVTASQRRLAHLSEVYDGDRDIPKRFATCEYDQFLLDGSMTLMPDDYTRERVGWWSELSDDSCEFVRPQIITVQFDKRHSSAGITCYYDDYSKPVESICRWYRGGELLAEHKLLYPAWTVESFNNANITVDQFNTMTVGSLNYGEAPAKQEYGQSLNGYDRIEIEMIQTQNPQTYVKLYEIDFGLTYALTGEQTQGAKVKEQVSLLSNTLYPNELSFNLENYERKYDLLNPSDLLRYFKKGQEVRVQAGVKNRKTGIFERVNMGKYYLDPPSSKSAKLTCKAFGILNMLLDDEDYYSPFWQDAAVADIVADILIGYDHYVHPNVGGIKLTGYIPTQNKKDALKVVAIAVGAIVKEGRDGKIYFYQATEELISNQIIAEDTVYTGWPHAGMLMAGLVPLPQTIIALPYVLKADRNTRLGDIDSKDIGSYTKVSVNYFNYGSADPAAELQELFSGEVITDEDGNAKITYSDAPVYDLTCDLPEGCTIKHYADVSLFHGDPGMIYELIVNGRVRKVSSATASATLPQIEIDPQAQTLVLDSCNELIGSAQQARAAARWYLEQMQKRLDISFKWWAVATTEASEYLEVETTYGTIVKAQISSIEYDLGSGLTATVKGVV
jgi:hypothetical protein|nr:MAG TPA: KOW2-KOW3 domains of Spt5, Spt5, RNA processing, Transcription [Caudoviricetes sp.]